jgi:DNA polymerase-3 subunit alpha
MAERTESKIKFVGLHAHSTFSVFDGLGLPDQHINFAYQNGMDALALTDHGNMNGLSYQVLHVKKMNAEGKKFKPIFGVEAYFIDSITKWKDEYEAHKTEKKMKASEEESGTVVENEEETKAEEKNILNRRAHLVILAMNQKGLNNLFSIVSESFKPGNFYRYPRVDFELLEKYNEGLIVSSACMGGVLSKAYWKNKEAGHDAVQSAMLELVTRFQSIFGDRFYGELQWHNLPDQHNINKHVIQVAQKTNLKLISTADSHYPNPDAWKDREIYKRLGWLNSKPDYDIGDLPQSRDDLKSELYPKNGDQMWESYKKYSKACGHDYDDDLVLKSFEETYHIAHERIESFYPDNTVRLPEFVVPEGKTAMQALTELSLKGLKQLELHKKPEYVERLKDELMVIKDRGFAKYFLTMKAVSDTSRQMQLCGAGRGSAAGSLISYVLDITQVDPIKYGFQFERFIRRDATDYPDIDFDVSDPMEIKEKLISDWGQNTVVPITNYNTLQFRSLIKDISKLYGVDFKEVNDVTSKMLVEATPLAKKKNNIKSGVYVPNYEELLEFSPTLQKFFEKFPQIKHHVEGLHGQIRSQSRHAGGVVIADNLNTQMPLINSGGVIQTPWSEGQNVRHLEPLGFIKFDILGLASLRMIEDCVRHILRRHKGVENPSFEDVKSFYEQNLHPEKMNLNDEAVYKNIFHQGKWAGIFQFAEKGAQKFCSKAKPMSVIDLSAITSIYRPGPLAANVHEEYVEAKNNPNSVRYIHPLVKEVTGETFGFLIFQEQIALLAHKLGKDLTLDEGNLLRKLLTKKGTGKGHEKKDAIHAKFVEGCSEKGIAKKDAQALWDSFEYFSGYGFNKSHAVAYSVLSYQCAYLLHYYPVEWLAAFLDKEPEEKKEKAINIAKSLGYDVLPCSINYSDMYWTVKDNNTLVQPLSSIKGLGEKAIEQILEHRPFKTIEELIYNENIVYSKLNKKALDVLVRCNALEELQDKRFKNMKHFWSCVVEEKPKKKEKFDLTIKELDNVADFTKEEKIDFAVTLAGVFPFSMVVTPKVMNKLEQNEVPPISEFDPDLGICWFIPREITKKTTKTGKGYAIVNVIDDTNQSTQVKVWGYSDNENIELNKPYLAKLDLDDWGFSTRSASRNWRCLM